MDMSKIRTALNRAGFEGVGAVLRGGQIILSFHGFEVRVNAGDGSLTILKVIIAANYLVAFVRSFYITLNMQKVIAKDEYKMLMMGKMRQYQRLFDDLSRLHIDEIEQKMAEEMEDEYDDEDSYSPLPWGPRM